MGSLYRCIVACAHVGVGVKLYFTVGGQAQWGGGYRLVTVYTHGVFIVLLHWDIRPPTSWHAIPLSHIILTLSKLVLSLS